MEVCFVTCSRLSGMDGVLSNELYTHNNMDREGRQVYFDFQSKESVYREHKRFPATCINHSKPTAQICRTQKHR